MATKIGSPRGFVGLIGMQGDVGEVVGLLQVGSTSTETAGIHGAAVDALPVSMMPAADPACSEQNENVGELDLGQESMGSKQREERGIVSPGRAPRCQG